MNIGGINKDTAVMDLEGISWPGNIYQKFEAMCLEVEEVMYQDTVKYLENQVQTVGSSVKKFYSEVMQDIRPSDFVDPVKVAAAELPLNPYSHTEVIKKPKVTMKRDLEIVKKKVEDYKMAGDINAELKEAVAELDDGIDHAKGDIGMRVFSNSYSVNKRGSASDKGCDAKEARSVNNSVCTSSARVDSPPSVNLSSDIKESNLEIFPETSDTDSDSEKPAHRESKTDTIYGSEPDEADVISSEGRSDNSTIDADSNDIGLEIIERLDESKFEDTCVLVEGNELQVVSQKKGKPKSYKKKLQEAFPLRMKSTRKREYENLAAQYSAHSSKREGMEQHYEDVPDSEWELL